MNFVSLSGSPVRLTIRFPRIVGEVHISYRRNLEMFSILVVEPFKTRSKLQSHQGSSGFQVYVKTTGSLGTCSAMLDCQEFLFSMGSGPLCVAADALAEAWIGWKYHGPTLTQFPGFPIKLIKRIYFPQRSATIFLPQNNLSNNHLKNRSLQRFEVLILDMVPISNPEWCFWRW